jgi:putative DNA primase/helicase
VNAAATLGLLPRATPESLDLVRRHAPPELRHLHAWVCGSREPKTDKDGNTKSSKVPINPGTGELAKSNDPTTWGTFDEAVNHALSDDRCFGVGVNLLGSEHLGFDLDHVVDAATGSMSEVARTLIDALPKTYTERSPSRTGLRLFFRGRKPATLRGSMFKGAFGPGTQLEVYDGKSGARYLTVTGDILDNEPQPIATATEDELQPLLDFLGRTLDEKERTRSTEQGISDDDLDRARFVLDSVFPDPDAFSHEEWLHHVMELASLGPEGEALAKEWSTRGKKHDPSRDCTTSHFAGFRGERKIASLFFAADNTDPGWRQRYRKLHGARNGAVPHDAQGEDAVPKASKLTPLGQRDPSTGRLVLSAKRTLPTAEAFVTEFYTRHDRRILHSYGGQLLEWRDNRYSVAEDERLLQELQPWLHGALSYFRRGPELELGPFEANPGTVNAALSTIRNHVHLPASTTTPSWLDGDGSRPPVLEVLPCRTMSLHIPTGQVLQPTPLLFNTNALDFDYDPNAAVPVRWATFLGELFGDDIESVDLLQEWFGYCLTADTSQQKMLLFVGPRRSGKGTIARILTQLVGVLSVVGPTVASLGGQFGLQPLIGKTLAVVSDARFHGENIGAVIERLLVISGEDAVSIDRKFLGAVTMKLPTRFMFLTNELPRLNDASTALAGRFLVLRLTRSFYGQENINLTDELLTELPGILLWALDGWRRLRAQGKFTEPQTSKAAVQDIEDLSSPVNAFVREKCVVGVGHRVGVTDLYSAWQGWCLADGRNTATTKQMFGRDLAAAVPGIARRRGTEFAPFYEGIALASASAS